MTTSCEPQLLSAYLDDELSPQARSAVEQHLRDCPQCTAELQRLREASQIIGGSTFEALNATELARIHAAIDDQKEEQPILRLGMMLSALAASILIISSAWLMEIPAEGGDGGHNLAVAAAPVAQWERVAMTLRAEPMPLQVDVDTDHSVQFADAQFAEWMLDGLKP